MTERLECPVEGCHATIEGETEQEVMAQAEEHAASSHPELELDDETVENIESNITEV
jgi:predicted small metal-binding protein